AGLNVEIVNGGPDVNLPLLVGSGRMNLGIGTSFTTLNMQARGIDAITVASFFQKDPQTLVAHGGQGITTLQDMRGRPIMVGNFARSEFWQFLKATQGFTDDQLRPYDSNPSAFLADKTAIAQGYASQDGVMLGTHMPEGMVSLLLADYGFDNYSQTVFGMRGWIEDHHEEVRRFVKATAEGYRRCTYEPLRPGDETTAMPEILRRNPEHGVPLYVFKHGKLRSMGFIGGGDAARLGIGAMTEARWHHFYQTMVKAGIYSPTLNWRRAYSLDYVTPDNRVMPPAATPPAAQPPAQTPEGGR
ncbi:MAG TPA: ABC transporter substrate-binding protein, partial [Novosphingobium sp.]|nr:ABC transporter substrate-binding protein [Novosphingobium sp.]